MVFESFCYIKNCKENIDRLKEGLKMVFNLCNCSFLILVDFNICEMEYMFDFVEDLKKVKYVGME